MGTYLFQRVLRDGHDSRFDEIKKSTPKFFVAWMAQATWCSLICLPVIALNAVPATAFAAIPGLRLTDVLGVALWVGGITLEATADKQKSQWLKEKREKKHSEDFMTRGLWQRRYVLRRKWQFSLLAVVLTLMLQSIPQLLRRVDPLDRHCDHRGGCPSQPARSSGHWVQRRCRRYPGCLGPGVYQPSVHNVPRHQSERHSHVGVQIRQAIWRTQGLPGVEEEHTQVLPQAVLST